MEDCYCIGPVSNSSTTCLTESFGKNTMIAVYIVLMVLSLVGNSLVVAVFYRNCALRTPLNYFVVNMAISDLLIPIFVLPRRVIGIDFNEVWLLEGSLGDFLCKLVNFAEDVATDVSILNMVLIGLERFHCVLFPLRGPLITKRACLRTITAIWIIVGASRAHYFYFCKLVDSGPGEERDMCEFVSGTFCETYQALKVQWLLFFTCFTAIPSILLVIFYSSIAVALNYQKQRVHMSSEAMKQRARENRRVTCMMAVTVLLFLSVWTPFNALFGIITFLAPCLTLPCTFVGMLSFEFLPFTHVALNPLVYFTFSHNYRRALIDLLCCCQSKLPTNPTALKNALATNRAINTINEEIELLEQIKITPNT